jgi:hypothetical protein
MLILIAGDMASEARMLAQAIAAESGGVVILGAPPRIDARKLDTVRYHDLAPALVDCMVSPVAAFDDYRRNDPARDVAMLRREMLARERSNRHMLKKGKGRR